MTSEEDGLRRGKTDGAKYTLLQTQSSASPSLCAPLPLSLPEYARYGRQMILPSVGLAGQLRLRDARVLVVGAGGLGCPSIQYLAAAGVGHISVVDHDVVESSNLARQILHTDERVGMAKAKSASIAAHLINPHVTVDPIEEAFSVQNAVELVRRHDLVLDCTDNVLTRYLISDAAVACGRQVVSGAAQGVEGQLVVLHKDLTRGAYCSGVSQRNDSNESGSAKNATARGPCYRCLFPRAPKPETVTDCEDGGVLGTITGLVGTMQAFEAINLLVGMNTSDYDEEEESGPGQAGVKTPRAPPPTFLNLVAPLSSPPFRSMKLRPRRVTQCRSCGDPQQMGAQEAASLIDADKLVGEDYMTFCGLNNPRSLKGFAEVTASEFMDATKSAARRPITIDVRPLVEFKIASIPQTFNVPIRTLDADPSELYRQLASKLKDEKDDNGQAEADRKVYVLCRRGNDSRLACHALAAAAEASAASAPFTIDFVNVKGGLRAWSKEVDGQFPVY